MADKTPPSLPQGALDQLLRGPSEGDAQGVLNPQGPEAQDGLLLLGLGSALARIDDPHHQSHREDISEDLLADYIEGLLEGEDSARVEEIIKGCAICQALHDGLLYELEALDAAGAQALDEADNRESYGVHEAQRAQEPQPPTSSIEAGIWRNDDPLGTDDKSGEMSLELRVYWGDMLRECRALSPRDGRLTLGVAKDDLFINPTHLPFAPFPLLTPRRGGQVTLRFSADMTGYVERGGDQIPLSRLIATGDATPESEGAVFAITLGRADRFVLGIGGERLTGTFVYGHKKLPKGLNIDIPFAGGLGALAMAALMALFFLSAQPEVLDPAPSPQGAPGRFAQVKMNYGGESLILLGESLDGDTISQAIEAHSARIQGCYGEGLAINPELAGEIAVRFTIQGDGTVAQSAVERSTLGDKDVEACVVEAIAEVTFPEFEGGEMLTVIYPIRFDTEASG